MQRVRQFQGCCSPVWFAGLLWLVCMTHPGVVCASERRWYVDQTLLRRFEKVTGIQRALLDQYNDSLWHRVRQHNLRNLCGQLDRMHAHGETLMSKLAVKLLPAGSN